MKDILPELNGKSYIASLQEDYDIHFCKIEEAEQLVECLKNNWNEDHIFVKSRELFDWQHYDKVNNRYNYVVAVYRKTGEIHSYLGFVPTYQFDSNIKKVKVWPCIWKSRDDIKVKGLGVSLYYYLKENLPIDTFAILGISEVALSIYKYWNFETDKIKHFYILNDAISEYQLVAGVENVKKCEAFADNRKQELREIFFEEYMNMDEKSGIFRHISEYKSKEYFIQRFYKHPIYHYTMLSVEENGTIQGILVLRECKHLNAKCVRIVDIIGNILKLKGIRGLLVEYLIDMSYEYIDFVTAGMNEDDVKNMGFADKNEYESLVVSNYFEPFILKNIELDYAYKTVSETSDKIIFKADADQDRPNLL